MLNAIETMAGDPVLAGCKPRVSTPGLLIELKLSQVAESEYLAEQERLEAEIQETERRLGQLQQAQAGSQATLLLSPSKKRKLIGCRTVIAARKNSDCAAQPSHEAEQPAPI